MKFAATIGIFYNFQIQKRIVSAETIWGNTVLQIISNKCVISIDNFKDLKLFINKKSNLKEKIYYFGFKDFPHLVFDWAFLDSASFFFLPITLVRPIMFTLTPPTALSWAFSPRFYELNLVFKAITTLVCRIDV